MRLTKTSVWYLPVDNSRFVKCYIRHVEGYNQSCRILENYHGQFFTTKSPHNPRTSGYVLYLQHEEGGESVRYFKTKTEAEAHYMKCKRLGTLRVTK